MKGVKMLRKEVGIELRDKAERERNSDEARRRRGENLAAHPRNVTRYVNPPRDTIYSLEYAYYLLSAVRHKTVLDLSCGAGENTLMLGGAKVVGLDLSPNLATVVFRMDL